MITFGACKVCAAKDSEIAFLRALVRPEPSLPSDPLPIITLEADAIIGGSDQQLQLVQPDNTRQAELDSEAATILAGTY